MASTGRLGVSKVTSAAASLSSWSFISGTSALAGATALACCGASGALKSAVCRTTASPSAAGRKAAALGATLGSGCFVRVTLNGSTTLASGLGFASLGRRDSSFMSAAASFRGCISRTSGVCDRSCGGFCMGLGRTSRSVGLTWNAASTLGAGGVAMGSISCTGRRACSPTAIASSATGRLLICSRISRASFSLARVSASMLMTIICCPAARPTSMVIIHTLRIIISSTCARADPSMHFASSDCRRPDSPRIRYSM